jgi:hypothetical protein
VFPEESNNDKKVEAKREFEWISTLQEVGKVAMGRERKEGKN